MSIEPILPTDAVEHSAAGAQAKRPRPRFRFQSSLRCWLLLPVLFAGINFGLNRAGQSWFEFGYCRRCGETYVLENKPLAFGLGRIQSRSIIVTECSRFLREMGLVACTDHEWNMMGSAVEHSMIGATILFTHGGYYLVEHWGPGFSEVLRRVVVAGGGSEDVRLWIGHLLRSNQFLRRPDQPQNPLLERAIEIACGSVITRNSVRCFRDLLPEGKLDPWLAIRNSASAGDAAWGR